MIFINFCIICLTESVRVWIVVYSRFMCRIVATRCTVYGGLVCVCARCQAENVLYSQVHTRRFGQNTTSIQNTKSGFESTTHWAKIKRNYFHSMAYSDKQKQPVPLQLIRSMNCNYYFIHIYWICVLFFFRFIYVYRCEMYWNCSRAFFSLRGTQTICFCFTYFAIDKRSNYFRHA